MNSIIWMDRTDPSDPADRTDPGDPRECLDYEHDYEHDHEHDYEHDHEHDHEYDRSPVTRHRSPGFTPATLRRYAITRLSVQVGKTTRSVAGS